VSDKYAFIDAEYAAAAAPTIERMCRWLQVSRSGHYEWLNRPASATAQRRELLKVKIQALFAASDGSYGYRRLHAELVRGGEQVGLELVRVLMRQLGLIACQPRPWRTTTLRGEEHSTASDLVGRDFTAETPGSKLVGDITYISTWAGWLYLATVIDCFNREVIGYAMADHMRTSLVGEALEMAARNHTLAVDCIFHSDRGTQYTSTEFGTKLAALHMRAIPGPYRVLLR
jgi:putative transposase